MLTAVRRSPVPARLALAVAAASLAPLAQAAFIEDSSATLQTHNIYLNRDFREGSGQSKREEWTQGFILDLQSGFTEGTVGVGSMPWACSASSWIPVAVAPAPTSCRYRTTAARRTSSAAWA